MYTKAEFEATRAEALEAMRSANLARVCVSGRIGEISWSADANPPFKGTDGKEHFQLCVCAKDPEKAALPQGWNWAEASTHYCGFFSNYSPLGVGVRGEKALRVAGNALLAKIYILAGREDRVSSVFALVRMFMKKQACFGDLKEALLMAVAK